MKSYVTLRRHPLDAVVARTNEDRHPREVVPYGRFSRATPFGVANNKKNTPR